MDASLHPTDAHQTDCTPRCTTFTPSHSLCHCLMQASSKGKAPMPSHILPSRSSPSSSIPINRSSSSLTSAQGLQHAHAHRGLHHVPSQASSREGSQHSQDSQHSSQNNSVHGNSRSSRERGRTSKDSNPSASSKGTSNASRSVRFDLPSSPDDSQNLDEAASKGDDKGLQSSPVSIAFRSAFSVNILCCALVHCTQC